MPDPATSCDACVFDLGRGECFHHRVLRACKAEPCGFWKPFPFGIDSVARTETIACQAAD